MPISPSPLAEAMVRRLLQAWRDGDVETIEALIADSDAVLLGNPGAMPPAIGRDAALEVVRRFAPMGRLPGMPKADFPEIRVQEDGDTAWAYADGVLSVPDKGRHRFRNALVLRREHGQWKWLQWLAFMPVPMQLIGSETLGFL